jgi:cytochrome c biogenesis protein CcdA
MSKIKRIWLFGLALFIILSLQGINISANQEVNGVYFASIYCNDCIGLENDGIFDVLEEQGYLIQKHYLETEIDAVRILHDFQFTYQLPLGSDLVPIIFVGSTYFTGRIEIREAVLSGELQAIMDSESLLPLESAPAANFSLIYFVLLGFVDGVNPCAIAMLLMFISLLSFTQKKSVLIKVSFTFIFAIFLSYFLFGTVLYRYLARFTAGAALVRIVPWVIIVLASVVFLLNLYDFVITMLKRYDKIKNQLPSGIQKFNRKLMQKFTEKLEDGSKGIYIITFFIGIIISFTEFLCTGQAYFTAILHLIHFTSYYLRGVGLLLLYNLIFVLPLVIIAVIAVKTQSVMGVSVFMREKLHWIKLFNAIVFLLIIIYYIVYVL